MLNKNLRWAICLVLIGVFLSIGSLSFADELPPVTIKASHGGTYPISSYGASHTAWVEHEGRLGTANQELQKLRYERDIIDAGISKNRAELRRLKAITVLVAGKKISMAAAVVPILELLNNGDMYELGLRRISKYAQIDAQNRAIVSAASDRDTFHAEYVKRWPHEMTHISSQVTGSPAETDKEVDSEYIPPLGAACKNMCGIFWYDDHYWLYYASFSGGIGASLFIIPTLARSDHHTTCNGKGSCGDWYWTCEGIERGGTARHKPRTCKKQALGWDSATSSFKTVTCNIKYRNCDNPGGRCFSGVVGVVDTGKHNDTPPSSSPVVSPTPTPTDGTPNCPDCTAHCLSPCSCSRDV